jgi:hypothetical protein
MELIEDIKYRCRDYYRFASCLNYVTYIMMNIKELKDEVPYLICVNTFAKMLSSYTFSVYEDICSNNSSYLIKAETNRVILRGCLEAVLIVDILVNNPKLQKSFYDNLYDDIKRINKIYNDSSKNRSKIYDSFNTDDSEDVKFAKRYAWLPKAKKKKANSMKDLLNYIDGLDEFDLSYYEVLIKALDLYAHPSFYLSKLIDSSNTKDNNLKLVDMIFKKDGIIDQLIESLLDSFTILKTDAPEIEVKEILESCLAGKETAFDLGTLDIKNFNRSILGLSTTYSKEQITYYFANSAHLEHNYQALSSFLPSTIHDLSYSIRTISTIIDSYYPKDFKNLTLIKLLNDLYPRYDDMIIAYFRNDVQGFYTQSRYIVEAVATLYIIFNEDEERSHVYFVHQDIKGYDFQEVSAEFNKKIGSNTDEIDKIIEANKKDLANNIEFVRQYYIRNFGIELDDTTLNRLNGWALYLKDLNNERVPNAPTLIEYAVSRITVNLPEILSNNINFTDFSLGLYEESCAYSHVTSYGWYNSIYALKDKSIFKQQFIVINLLVNLIVNLITDGYKFEEKAPKDLIEKLDDNFNLGMSKLLMNYIK